MQFISDIILPDEKRPATFSGFSSNREPCYYRFKCQVCENPLKFEIWDFIKEHQNWKQEFSEVELDQIQNYYHFKKHSPNDILCFTSPFGGHPYIGIKKCGACRQKYLIYIGLCEKSMDYFVATVQGIAKIE